MAKKVVYKPAEPVKPIYPGGTIKPPEYMPSLYEWLSAKGEQIKESATCGKTTSVKIIYTVPLGYRLFLNYFWLNHDTSNSATEREISLRADDKKLIYLFMDNASSKMGIPYEVTLNIPIIIGGGVSITVNNPNSSQGGTGGFTGFLVRNNNIPSF